MTKKMTAADLIDFDDLQKEEITIKQWRNLKLLIVEMTGEERDKAIEAATNGELIDQNKYSEQLIIASVKDPDTKLPFFDAETIKILQKKSWQVVEQIARAVMRVNGTGQRAAEEAEKN